MSAFVPHVPVNSASTFVNGAAVQHQFNNRLPLGAPEQSSCDASTVTMMADDKKGFKLPSLPSLPNVGNILKKGDAKKAPAAPKAVAKAPVIPNKVTKPVIRAAESAAAAAAAAPKSAVSITKEVAKPLPKFYNPTTARYEFAAEAKGQNATPFDLRVINEYTTPSGNSRVNENETFRNMDLYTDDLYWARPGWSVEQANVGVQVALKQVFGNANLFEDDVKQLDYSISCVKKTANIKEFVRALGLSELYRTKFFESTSNLRFIELNFKHFLGRAPYNQEEISKHIQIINEEGYNAEINSYVDSDEYDYKFGDSRIPSVNFQGGYLYNVNMNRLAILNGSWVTPDNISKTAYLNNIDNSKYPAFSVLKGLPTAWRGENTARAEAGFINDFPVSPWNPVPEAVVSDELAWKMKFGSWQTYWYKDTPMYKNIMKPMLTHSSEEKEEAEAILKYGSTVAKLYYTNRE